MMKKTIKIAFLAAGTLCFYANIFANTYGLFPSGSTSKGSAIESAIDAREAAGLLYNPALLSVSKPGLTGELGLGRLLYRYEHPQFDPVSLNVTSPMVSAGWSSSDIAFTGSSIRWGIAVLPTSMATLKIAGLPRRINGTPESLNVETSRRQFHIPVGISWNNMSMDTSRLSIGAALIATYDERSLKANSLVDQANLVDTKAKGTFYRPNVGILYGYYPSNSEMTSQAQSQNLESVELGVSFTKSLAKGFKGKTTLAGTKDEFDTETVDFDPAMLMTGFKVSLTTWRFSLNINRLLAQSGSSIVRDGLNRKTDKADLRDVNQIGAKIEYQISEDQSISAAAAYLPTIWGAGFYSKNSDLTSEHELGHLFGNFNAMPVRNQAISHSLNLGSYNIKNTFFRTAGKHSIDRSGDNPGHYQLEFISWTTGVNTQF
ncbi:MAG: hypothetical protein NT027_03190 [Proteobacteria bacterium]|nr:hypothetical protein [Pseudomonadota bacterium]